jgi:hypothetical protein
MVNETDPRRVSQKHALSTLYRLRWWRKKDTLSQSYCNALSYLNGKFNEA